VLIFGSNFSTTRPKEESNIFVASDTPVCSPKSLPSEFYVRWTAHHGCPELPIRPALQHIWFELRGYKDFAETQQVIVTMATLFTRHALCPGVEVCLAPVKIVAKVRGPTYDRESTSRKD
jgi:hypothetical protein